MNPVPFDGDYCREQRRKNPIDSSQTLTALAQELSPGEQTVRASMEPR